MAWDLEPTPSTSTLAITNRQLPHALESKSYWTAPETERIISQQRGDIDNITCHLCQQHFTTSRRLRVHTPQHYITTFCPCGEYSCQRDYKLRHQHTMNCFQSHIFNVDEFSYPRFFELIQPFVLDKAKLERLLQGFSAPRPITYGAVSKPPNYQKLGATHKESSYLLPFHVFSYSRWMPSLHGRGASGAHLLHSLHPDRRDGGTQHPRAVFPTWLKT